MNWIDDDDLGFTDDESDLPPPPYRIIPSRPQEEDSAHHLTKTEHSQSSSESSPTTVVEASEPSVSYSIPKGEIQKSSFRATAVASLKRGLDEDYRNYFESLRSGVAQRPSEVPSMKPKGVISHSSPHCEYPEREEMETVIAKSASAFEVEGEEPRIPSGLVNERRALFGDQSKESLVKLRSEHQEPPQKRRSYIIVRSTADGHPMDQIHSSTGSLHSSHAQSTSSLHLAPHVRIQTNDSEGKRKHPQRPQSHHPNSGDLEDFQCRSSDPLSHAEEIRFSSLPSHHSRSTHNIRDEHSDVSHADHPIRSSTPKTIPISIGRKIDIQATIHRPSHPLKVDVVRIGITRPDRKSRNELRTGGGRGEAVEEFREDTKEIFYDRNVEQINQELEEIEALRLQKELEDAREMNKKLSAELARVEREKQQFEIERNISDHKNEAEVASRVADVINNISLGRSPEVQRRPLRQRGELSECSSSRQSLLTTPRDSIRISKESSAESLDPNEIRRNLERMIACIQSEAPIQEPSKEESTNYLPKNYTVQTTTEDNTDSTLLGEPRDSGDLKTENVQLRAEMGDLRDALDRSTILLDQMSSSVRFSKRSPSPSHQGSLGSSISGDEDHLNDIHHGELMSLRSQVQIHEQQISNKELLIRRLERDLADAQQCNQKLNSQLGTLATNGATTIKKEIIEIKKELKDRTNEVDQLKKKLQKADKDRQTLEAQKRQLESKLPTDVQTLMAQKRELTQQLDREQNEKHELFMQINSMIAQLADSSGESNQAEVDGLKAENDMLRQRILDVENLMNKENQKLSEDLRKAQQECEMQKVAFDLEKKQMSGELQQLQADVAMKSAALQSLMLAKQEPKADPAELDRVREEKRGLEKEISELKASIESEKRSSESQISEFTSKLATLTSQLETSRSEYNEAETKLKNAERESSAEVQRKINSLETELKTSGDRISECTSKIATLTSELETSRLEHKETETRLKNVERESSAESQRKVNALQTELKTSGDKISLLEFELSQSKKEMDTLRENSQQLENREKETSKELEKLSKTQNELHEEQKLRRDLQVSLDKLTHLESAQRDELQEKLFILERKMKEKEEEHESLRSLIGSTQSKLDMSESEAKAARALADTNERRANTLQQQLETQSGSQSEQVSLLRGQLSASESLEGELRKKLQEQEQSAQESLRSLQQQLSHIEEKLKSSSDREAEKVQDLERERLRNTEKEQEVKAKVAELSALQTKLDVEKMNGEEGAQRIRQLEKEVTELESERKKLEAKASVADELKTLMGNLQQARQENSDLQAEICNLHEETKALRESADMWQTECNEWKVRAETAESERNVEREKLQSHSTTLTSLHEEKEKEKRENAARLEAERKRVEEEKAKALAEKEAAHAHEKLKAKEEQEKLEKEAAEKMTALQKKYEELEVEAATSKRTLEEIKEERARSLSNADDERNRIVEESLALKEKTRNLESEKDQKQKRIGELEEKIQKTEEEATTAKSELLKSQDALMALQSSNESNNDKMREAEEFATQIRKQLEEIEAENREKLEQKDMQHKAAIMAFGDKVASLESQLAQSSSTLQESVNSLKSELEKERSALKETQMERDRLKSELNEREKLVAEVSSKDGDEEKIKELENENVRLSGELLKTQTELERNVREERVQAEKAAEEKVKSHEARIISLESELDSATSSLKRKERDGDMLRDEVRQAQMEADSSRSDYNLLQSKLRALEFTKSKLEDELEEAKKKSMNGHSETPVPRMNRTLSNMSRMSYVESIMQTDDPDKLKGEIERQHRLIVVLRRKLQKLQ